MENFTVYILIITSIRIVSNTSVIPNRPCNRIRVGNRWYERHVLLKDIGRPYNLHVHKETNTLFFSYSLTETYADVDFQIAWFNLDTTEYQTIAGIKGGCAIAIDQDSDEVYLGGSDGIYKFNMMTRLADVHKQKGKNIWGLFHRKNLFYISYPDQKLYIEIDGKFSVVKEFEHFEVDHFFVSVKDEIYFSNKTGLYTFDKANLRPEIVNEYLSVRQIVEDNAGELYICSNVGILTDSNMEGLKKIVDMKNIYGLTFDKNNHMIYSDDKGIIRLMYSEEGCMTDNRLQW